MVDVSIGPHFHSTILLQCFIIYFSQIFKKVNKSQIRRMSILDAFCFMKMFIITLICSTLIPANALNMRESDHLSLLAIKSKIVSDPEGSLGWWNNSVHFCQWEGVTCGLRHRRVTALDLSSRSLVGSLSPFVGNLSFLRELWLYNNTLEGVIPTEIGHLFRLEKLILFNNSFEGNVPASLSNCTNLTWLSIGRNKLVGTILQEVGSLLKLVNLSIHYNNFTGRIPPSVGNLTSLEIISASGNHLGGSIPHAIGQLKKLWFVGLGINQLHGTIPPSFYNLSLLSTFSTLDNQLVGSIPQDINLKLPKLQVFNIWGNKFTGLLPVSISNFSKMEVINVGYNRFHGKISIDFGMMPNLWHVGLNNNVLGSGEPDELNFIASLVNSSRLEQLVFENNQLRGQLPSCVGNLSTQLSFLSFDHNLIYGSIPPSIMNLISLAALEINANQFTGTIPCNIGNLYKLQLLDLSENSLTGHIPESVGNLSLLGQLSLSSNRLQGTIPATFRNCRNMNLLFISSNNLTGSIPRELLGLTSLSISLDLSFNHLSGTLPQEIGNLHSLEELYLSENKLTGEVPDSIGDCISLEDLYMEGNHFHGLIPASFDSLRGIKNLDLSRNNFSGHIPRFLEKFSLKNLNLSFNDFEGELPIKGVFNNATTISVAGNNKLCGGLPELRLPKCSNKDGSKSKKRSFALIIVVPITCLLVGLAFASCWFFIWHKRKRKTLSSGFVLGQQFTKYSYEMLLKATNMFSLDNLIGVGGFSSVYKGVLEEDGATVAVKVLNLDLRGASKSFMAECEAWRNIRHRNLVRIISACSSVDFQGNDFKALVYEFMANGSVEGLLHSSPGTLHTGNEPHGLSLLQRVSIATDVSHAIDYLHHRCEIPIIHCDLKPSNILLDEDMVAHVGDFGLARFFLAEVSNINQSSSIGLRGTIGYAPPEYGLGSEMTPEGDVYSFGITLLEMMTGKRPTNNMFQNGLNLHDYVRTAFPDSITDILDAMLVKEEENETRNQRYAKARMECMVSVVKTGIACSVESAKDRMNISKVVDELQRIYNIISKHETTVVR